MAGRRYSDAEIDAAVAALSEPGRLDDAQRIIGQRAPQLQRILSQALQEADWFGSAHSEQLLKAAGVADPDERLTAVRTMLAEETRLAMLIGVAVGLELGNLLDHRRED